MPIRMVDGQGRSIRISRDYISGGEGRIHEVVGSPELLAKVYHTGSAGAEPEKLRHLIAAKNEVLLRIAAWPITTLHEGTATGPLVGLLMPKVSGYEEIHKLYGPEDRLRLFPDADWRTLALAAANIAAAFQAVHEHGILVGDVNQKNVLVAADGSIRLIDCDSFQVRRADGRVFRCGVGLPEFTPPELQGFRPADIDRVENHDRFGLAVIIFHLLFVNRHPYSGVYPNSVNVPVEQAIRENLFAYTRNTAARRSSPPPGALSLDAVPFSLAELFERAFAPPGTRGDRPSAAEWQSALAEFRHQLRQCQSIQTHVYHPVARRCPWCLLEARHQYKYFRHVPFSLQQPRATKPAPPVVAPWLRSVAMQCLFGLLLLGAVALAMGRGGSAVLALRFESLLREASAGDAAARARLQEFGPPAIYSLANELDAEDPAIARTAEEVLNAIDRNWRTDEGTKRAAVDLAAGLESEYEDEMCRALTALKRTGPGAAALTARLARFLLQNEIKYKDEHMKKIHSHAVETLRAVDPNWFSSAECRQVVAQLSIQLERSRNRGGTLSSDDPEEEVVAHVLGQLGPAARPAIPGLVVSLAIGDGQVFKSASEALRRIDPAWERSVEARQAIPRLAEFAEGKWADPISRAAWRQMIRTIDPAFYREEVDRESAQKPIQMPGHSGMSGGSTVAHRPRATRHPPGVIVVPPPDMRARPGRPAGPPQQQRPRVPGR